MTDHQVMPAPLLHRLLPLAGLTQLSALKLQHCQGIRRGADLAPLSALTALSSLNLSGCSQTEGAGIASLATLTCLRCGRSCRNPLFPER